MFVCRWRRLNMHGKALASKLFARKNPTNQGRFECFGTSGCYVFMRIQNLLGSWWNY